MSKSVSSLELRENHLPKQNYQNNIIPFPPHLRQRKFDEVMETEYSLSQEPHLIIVSLGALIGGLFALFMMYHINSILISCTLFAVLPFIVAFIMRKIYIYTTIQENHSTF